MKHALVQYMATVCFLAAFSVSSISQGQNNQLGSSGNGVADHNQQSLKFGWVPPSGEASPVRIDEETDYQKSLRGAYDGRLDRRVIEPYRSFDPKGEIKESTKKKDFTPKHITKQGNENKNYVVMISASWCGPCKKMYPEMKKLREKGYIIYIFDTTKKEFEDYAALYAINAYPTFIVYDKGKEVRRSVGVTNKSWFKKHLKLKKNQKDEKKEPNNPYDGL